MGPGNSAECAGECAMRCKVASSMESKGAKTESRGNRIRGCGAGVRVGVAGRDGDRSGGGLRNSSGRPCIRRKRVSRDTPRGGYSGIRSHLWACKASSSSADDSLSSSSVVSCGVQPVQSHSSILLFESPFVSVLADNRRTGRTHSQSCVTSVLLPGMAPVLRFSLSSLGFSLDSGGPGGGNAACVERVFGWGAARAGRAEGGSESR